MYKSRRGIALVMALVVVLVGGAIIAVTFDFVFRYSWFSADENVGLIDHTTMLDAVQTVKARIVSTNIATRAAGGGMWHAVNLMPHQNSWRVYELTASNKPDLKLDDLRLFPQETRDVSKETGVGRDRVVVEVFDMFFHYSWLDLNELENSPAGYPSIFNMLGDVSAGDAMVGESDFGGGTTESTGGSIDDDDRVPPPDPSSYGAYLIRARLFDAVRERPVRTVEEAFVQVIRNN